MHLNMKLEQKDEDLMRTARVARDVPKNRLGFVSEVLFGDPRVLLCM